MNSNDNDDDKDEIELIILHINIKHNKIEEDKKVYHYFCDVLNEIEIRDAKIILFVGGLSDEKTQLLMHLLI